MKRGLLHLVCAIVLIAFASAVTHAQSSSLSGVVTDAGGGTVPGATVTVQNQGTKVSLEAISNEAGQFSFPALDAGTYTVTVALAGFKTFVARDLRLLSARPGSVNATLEVGALTESVEVKAGSELVQTQSTTVANTLSVEQLSEMPLISRNALYAVSMLPGVATTGGPRGAIINGLPNNTVNVTIDGVNTGNMLQSTDGFFSMITPRMDAVEEITVSGAVPGSGSGAGSVQVGFITRSGTNRFENSLYHYWRSPKLNSKDYFGKINGLDKNNVILHQFGGRSGGPIIVPGLFDGRNKAFYFFNYEQLYQPNEATRTRTMLRDSVLDGIFTYQAGAGTRTVNLMELARQNGQVSTFDPTVLALLQQIRSGAQTTGAINDIGAANTLQYIFQSPARLDQYAPTSRVDFNLSDAHRLSGTYWLQRFKSLPDLLNNRDPRFPGLPNLASQNSYRTTGSSTLRSTIGANMVNELRGGWQWSPQAFYTNVTASQFENQGGYGLSFPANTGTDPTHTISPAPRNTTTWSVSNTLNWLRGRHSISMGGSYAGLLNRINSYTVVPNIVLGFDTTNDPANAMFSPANFSGASAAQLTEARNIYALLTGRVLSIPGTARLNAETGEYVYNGELVRKSRQSSFAAFVQDSWRVTPTLTVNGGLRWDLHLPFTPVTATYSRASLDTLCGVTGQGSGPFGRSCAMFQPGVLNGTLPTYTLFEPGTPAYNTNYRDFAPNAGIAWRPNVEEGWLRALLGDPSQATIRAGYSLSYNQERIDRFENNATDNPGGALNVVRNTTTGFPLVGPGETHPVLFRDRDRLGPPDFPTAPRYPLAATTADNVNIFPDRLRTPRVHSYSVGVQRSLGSDMAMEVRYVGNRNLYAWAEENWNERNIHTNGFLDEFRAAQANLVSHVAAGCGTAGNPACSFAYRGPGTGTTPLPIHLAYLGGSADAGNAAAYTSANFTNPTFVARFGRYEPTVITAVNALDTTALRANAARAGLPVNFFQLNPNVGGAWVVQDKNNTRYDSLQIDLRRRLSKGLLVSGSYTYGIRKGTLNPGPGNVAQTTINAFQRSLYFDRLTVDTTDVPHAYKLNWYYELPIGRGRRFGGNMNRVLNAVVGDWEFSGNSRFQQQRYRMIGVKLEGMSVADLQDVFEIRTAPNAAGAIQVFSFPQDIIDNTRAAFNSDPTSPTGYSTLGVPTGRYIRPASDASCAYVYRGDCGASDINLNGPLFKRVDLKLTKKFPLLGSANIEFSAEVMNVFDTPNFDHSVDFNPTNSLDTFRVTSAYSDINSTSDPGGRIGQLVWRINW